MGLDVLVGDPRADTTILWLTVLLVALAVAALVFATRWLAGRRNRQILEELKRKRQSLRREQLLSATAGQLLTTFDRDRVLQLTVGGITSGLAIRVAVEPLLDGPAEATTRPDAMVLSLGSEHRLILSSPIDSLQPDDLDWLRRLTVLAEAALTSSRAHSNLQNEAQRLRHELTAKDEFLSLMGHELRTPLTSIHGFSQLIDRNLSVIKQQVGQLDRLISDLVAEADGRGGTLSLDLQKVDMAELVRSALERFRAAHPDRKLELDLGPAVAIKADPARLNQVIDNLLTNAVKYSPPNQPIWLRVEQRDADLVLSVQDRGAGVSKEDLPHLFERFYRAPHASAGDVSGLGLGLSIVRELVEAHGGRVWAESDGPGRGSTFFVSLPCWPHDGHADTAEQPPSLASVRLGPLAVPATSETEA